MVPLVGNLKINTGEIFLVQNVVWCLYPPSLPPSTPSQKIGNYRNFKKFKLFNRGRASEASGATLTDNVDGC